MARLQLNIKGEYFHQIKSGEKVQEFRLFNDYWKKRLVNREYTMIDIKLGYPKSDDISRIESRPYRGYEVKTIQHKHFGTEPVKVFAIWVN